MAVFHRQYLDWFRVYRGGRSAVFIIGYVALAWSLIGTIGGFLFCALKGDQGDDLARSSPRRKRSRHRCLSADAAEFRRRRRERGAKRAIDRAGGRKRRR